MRYPVWGTGMFNIFTMISILMVMILDCVPFDKDWDVSLKGNCVDAGTFVIASGSISIVTDAVNIALPICVFVNLDMSLRRRLGLLLIFSLGVL